MTYKLNPALNRIQSPLVVVADGKETEYIGGKALSEQVFEKNYLVDSITAKADRIVISLVENSNAIPNGDSWEHSSDSLSFF